tara:strand:- start:871 stop:1065 length:195 start_codon:yes stop_codon:yes gene_type:complete
MTNGIKIDNRDGNKNFAVLSNGKTTVIIQGNKGIHPRTILLNADELREMHKTLARCLEINEEAA